MERMFRRVVAMCAVLVLASAGCSATSTTAERDSDEGTEPAAGADESAGQAEAGGDTTPKTEADDGAGDASQAGAKDLSEGFEAPASCPEIVEVSLPDEEKSLPELHEWYCGRLEATGTPSYEAPEDASLPDACTVETVASQGATRNVSGGIYCYDGEGRQLASMSLRQGELSSVSARDFNDDGDVVRDVTRTRSSCSVTLRKGDVQVTFRSADGGGFQATQRVEYDEQGREIKRFERPPNGETTVTTIEYTSTDEKTTKTTLRDGQKVAEDVEHLREDGTVERRVERNYSNGELNMSMETKYDQQGRPVRMAPTDASPQKFASVETKEYKGDADHPVRRKVAQMMEGKEQGTVTATYKLDDQGRPVTSSVEFSSGETAEESWTYENGRLVEKSELEMLTPNAGSRPLMGYELEYDEQGRLTSHHRWRGDKDSSRSSKWKTTLTYECMK